MKSSRIIPLLAVGLLMMCSAATSRAEDLFNATITAKVSVQGTKTERVCQRVGGQRICDEFEVKTIDNFSVNNRTLINLLLGGAPIIFPPPNLTFGISFGCEGEDNAQLVIFDRTTSNMVVIADITDRDLIFASKVLCTGNGPCEVVDSSFEGFLKLTFRPLGDPGTNSIDGGEIRLYVKGSVNPEGCILKASGSGSGKLDATREGEDLDVFISNFTLTSGKKLGTLPPPIVSSESSSSSVVTSGSSTTLSGSASSSAVIRQWMPRDTTRADKWLNTADGETARSNLVYQLQQQ